MTQGQRWIVGGCFGAAALIFSVTLAVSISHESQDPGAVLRGAAWSLTSICVMVGLATIIVSQLGQQKPPPPQVVYADRESMAPFNGPELPQYDTTDLKRAKAVAYVDRISGGYRGLRQSRRRF